MLTRRGLLASLAALLPWWAATRVRGETSGVNQYIDPEYVKRPQSYSHPLLFGSDNRHVVIVPGWIDPIGIGGIVYRSWYKYPRRRWRYFTDTDEGWCGACKKADRITWPAIHDYAPSTRWMPTSYPDLATEFWMALCPVGATCHFNWQYNPQMTVERVDRAGIHCVWFHGTELRRGCFAGRTLTVMMKPGEGLCLRNACIDQR